MTFRHRKISLLVALLVALAGLVIVRPAPSSAAEICDYNVLLNGYKEVSGPYSGYSETEGDNYSVGISVWLRKSDRAKMVMIQNNYADGKSNFLGTATSTGNVVDDNLGWTKNVPAGQAWCSSLTKAAYIAGRVSYRVGGVPYVQAIYWGP